jgi:hypothetical protein
VDVSAISGTPRPAFPQPLLVYKAAARTVTVADLHRDVLTWLTRPCWRKPGHTPILIAGTLPTCENTALRFQVDDTEGHCTTGYYPSDTSLAALGLFTLEPPAIRLELIRNEGLPPLMSIAQQILRVKMPTLMDEKGSTEALQVPWGGHDFLTQLAPAEQYLCLVLSHLTQDRSFTHAGPMFQEWLDAYWAQYPLVTKAAVAERLSSLHNTERPVIPTYGIREDCYICHDCSPKEPFTMWLQMGLCGHICHFHCYATMQKLLYEQSSAPLTGHTTLRRCFCRDTPLGEADVQALRHLSRTFNKHTILLFLFWCVNLIQELL